jgi:hypothetical protein
MSERIALYAQIRPGCREELERRIAAGPPFDLEESSFDRHEVYLGETEIVFVFEGERPLDGLRRMSVERMKDMIELGGSISTPRIVRGSTPWERPPYPLSFEWRRQPPPQG